MLVENTTKHYLFPTGTAAGSCRLAPRPSAYTTSFALGLGRHVKSFPGNGVGGLLSLVLDSQTTQNYDAPLPHFLISVLRPTLRAVNRLGDSNHAIGRRLISRMQLVM